MADQCLESGPVPPGVSNAAPQHAARVDVDSRDYPSVFGVADLDVVRGDHARLFDVHQPVPQDIATQQHFAGATLELAKVQARRCQLQALVVPGKDLGGGDEQLTATDLGDQTCHCRVVVLAQAHDDVNEFSQPLSGAVHGGAAQQCGQQQ